MKQIFFYVEPTHSVHYNLIVCVLRVMVYELKEIKTIFIDNRC